MLTKEDKILIKMSGHKENQFSETLKIWTGIDLSINFWYKAKSFILSKAFDRPKPSNKHSFTDEPKAA